LERERERPHFDLRLVPSWPRLGPVLERERERERPQVFSRSFNLLEITSSLGVMPNSGGSNPGLDDNNKRRNPKSQDGPDAGFHGATLRRLQDRALSINICMY
jgi:hypothetical protein